MRFHRITAAMILVAGSGLLQFAQAADLQRQAEVAQRGTEVMPFDLKATTHVFTKTSAGGTQRVVAKNPKDHRQVRLVRQHLKEIRKDFARGDFSGPAHIHGSDMPGLAQLKAATPGAVKIAYRDVDGGAELAYSTKDSQLGSALHQWFDAQLSDHGTDAVPGDVHMHHGHSPSRASN